MIVYIYILFSNKIPSLKLNIYIYIHVYQVGLHRKGGALQVQVVLFVLQAAWAGRLLGALHMLLTFPSLCECQLMANVLTPFESGFVEKYGTTWPDSEGIVATSLLANQEHALRLQQMLLGSCRAGVLSSRCRSSLRLQVRFSTTTLGM